MRWTQLAAALVVVTNAAACVAEMPEWTNSRPQATQLFQGRLLGGQGWWSRYGEPVNASALASAESSTTNNGPMPMYGDGGYVYGPGTCDCSPPCIWNLWNGYFQNPCRCHNHHCHLFHKHCGCNACDGDGGCGGHGHGLHGKLFGHGWCCANSCSSGSCGCAAPTCSTPSADCGCKPVCGKCHHCHLGHKFRAHWNCGCDSCSAPLSCGCTTPTPALPGSEKQAVQELPRPMPEEAGLNPLRRLR